MFDYSQIPEEMKREKRWVCWAGIPSTTLDGKSKVNKQPVNPYTLGFAMPNNPNTWGNFSDAVKHIGELFLSNNGKRYPITGVGFMLGNGWAGIDIDGGSQHTGGMIPQSVVDDFCRMKTYAEKSQSGDGFHFIGRYNGEIPNEKKAWNHNTGKEDAYQVQMFFSGYFAITGNIYQNHVYISDITNILPSFYEKYIGRYVKEQEKDNPSTGKTLVNMPDEINEFLRENLSDMLNYIDSDIDYKSWCDIGMALKHEGFDVSVWDAFSSKGAKYPGSAEIQRKWNSFRKNNGKVVTGATITYYAKQQGWKPKHITHSYTNQGQGASADFAEVVEEMKKETSAEVQPAAAPGIHFVNAAESLDKFLSVTKSEDYNPIPTGFKALDSKLNNRGFDPGTLSVFMAAPATGKTALSMMIGENLAASGIPVMVFNFEMSNDQLIARSLSRRTFEKCGGRFSKDAKGAVSGVEALYSREWWTLTREQQEKLIAADADFRKDAKNLYLMTDCTPYAENVIKLVNAFVEQTKKAPVVIIDYLQLMATDGKKSAVYDLKDVAIALKQQIARKYNTHVLLISATNRKDAESGEYSMQSGFGSSFIEYSADYVFSLAPIEKEKRKKGKRKKVDKFTDTLILTLQKGRMTKPYCEQGFYFTGVYSLFEEMPDEELEKLKKIAEEQAQKTEIQLKIDEAKQKEEVKKAQNEQNSSDYLGQFANR